jgi:hypothetical protein
VNAVGFRESVQTSKSWILSLFYHHIASIIVSDGAETFVVMKQWRESYASVSTAASNFDDKALSVGTS